MGIEEIIEVLEANGYTSENLHTLSKNEILELVCNYEGLVGYASWIKRTIKNIYGMEVQ